MAKLQVLVLGAGFGGLELAARLSDAAADQIDVTIIDQNDSFVFGYSKLDVMFGITRETWRTYYRDLNRPSVTFRQERIIAVDPVAKTVRTTEGEYRGDVIVIALGADLDVAATPGLTDNDEFYSVAGAERFVDRIRDFNQGHAVVAVAATPYKCPPAPSEVALMLHHVLTQRGTRKDTDITVVSPLPSPVPPSPETSAALLSAFEERGITFRGSTRMTAVDGGRKIITLDDGEQVGYDLLLAIPRHTAPDVLSSLPSGNDGWVQVDPHTLLTAHPDVYAIGDCADAPVPRAGAFAERAAVFVAERVLAMLDNRPVAPYDGYGSCYIEFGGGRVASVEVTFMSAGTVKGGPFNEPSLTIGREKEDSGPARIARWFGGAGG
ncbi:MAG TPA: FAD/NAD(P)-binding oxidoreductase [Mycobacteriales bacterium]|nr:FAD/NAD(P)-binding oxidoreductase [Mycobacteriales bacterium]